MLKERGEPHVGEHGEPYIRVGRSQRMDYGNGHSHVSYGGEADKKYVGFHPTFSRHDRVSKLPLFVWLIENVRLAPSGRVLRTVEGLPTTAHSTTESAATHHGS